MLCLLDFSIHRNEAQNLNTDFSVAVQVAVHVCNWTHRRGNAFNLLQPFSLCHQEAFIPDDEICTTADPAAAAFMLETISL
jgi:hypothetical protein